jgi:hypothetical protein
MNHQILIMFSLGLILSILALSYGINKYFQPVLVAALSLLVYILYMRVVDGGWVIYKDPLWAIFFFIYLAYSICENIVIQVVVAVARWIKLSSN